MGKIFITITNCEEITKMIKRLNSIRRWTTLITEGKYNENSKQALNCAICYILAKEAESKGTTINWTRFPQIAIHRAFQKAYVNYDTPEYILTEICEMGEIQFKKSFGEVTNQIIGELTDDNFIEFLKEGIGTIEEEIYKAATKIATFLELKEIKRHINGDYDSKYEEVVKSMYKYQKIPGFSELSDADGEYFELFYEISKLRNQNRWAAYSYAVDCSVLGHLFDTAVYAYMMALEKGEIEAIATKCFFMGIFHDVPEAFTRDIPSPIKDKIPGFRQLTEKYELLMMEREVYPRVSEYMKSALQEIMFEDDQNIKFKSLIKGADYMSAVTEIWRQLKAGTRDEAFVTALEGHKEKFDAGVAEITPVARMHYEKILQYAEKLDL